MQNDPSIVVFSHLRWNFVYQRPQHILARMAKNQRVFFIEEPVHTPDAPARWECNSPQPNLIVCTLHTPLAAPGFHDEHYATFIEKLDELCETHAIDEHVAWLYTPMALPLAAHLEPQCVVYDCMDELAAFLHAPPALIARENALLEWADLVFTGGPSLYQAKRTRHPHVYCFPSSVDAAHFRQARTMSEAPDQRDLPHPRLGFYGVIDERIDLEVLDTLATSHPEWQIIMIGPVVKIDPATLPRHPNLHYFGQRNYNDLPSYLAGWDVCLMPFARNEATRFISPTKTLEYMVAEKPIVTTPITDVVEPYGNIVYIGDTPAAFVNACERAFAADDAERACHLVGMRAVLAATAWDTTVQQMQALIESVLEEAEEQKAA
jgi:UDP-galactopyranose mutase